MLTQIRTKFILLLQSYKKNIMFGLMKELNEVKNSYNRTLQVKKHLVDSGILSPISSDEKTGTRKVIRKNYVKDLYTTVTFGYYSPSFIEE